MTSATEYLGIAALLMLSINKGGFPEDRVGLTELFESTYQWKCDEIATERVVRQLEAWGAITINHDRFAGETFVIFADNIRDARALIRGTKLNDVLKSGDYGGGPWFKKVFGHKDFWNEVYAERDAPVHSDHDPITIEIDHDDVAVPAADRLVTLAHNQQAEIEVPITEVLELVEAENSIDGDVGLRELVLGRLRAGRELVRAGVFSVRSLHLTLIVGLQMLVEKYGDAAIAIAASKLLDLLLAQHGIG